MIFSFPLRRGLSLIALLLAAAGCATAQPPGGSVKITRTSFAQVEPVSIEALRVGAQVVTFGQAFQVANVKTWVSDLIVRVRNNSGQPIKYVEIEINFPSFDQVDAAAATTLRFGVMPDDGVSPDRVLQGATVDLRNAASLWDDAFDGTKPEFYVSWVIFEDGSAWRYGNILQRRSDGLWTLPQSSARKQRNDSIVLASFQPATQRSINCSYSLEGARTRQCGTCTVSEDRLRAGASTNLKQVLFQCSDGTTCSVTRVKRCSGNGGTPIPIEPPNT